MPVPKTHSRYRAELGCEPGSECRGLLCPWTFSFLTLLLPQPGLSSCLPSDLRVPTGHTVGAQEMLVGWMDGQMGEWMDGWPREKIEARPAPPHPKPFSGQQRCPPLGNPNALAL